MAMVDFSCRVPSTIRWHRHSAPCRLAPVTDASPPSSSEDGLLGNDLRAKRADLVTARTPGRTVLATPARGSTKVHAVQAVRLASPRQWRAFPTRNLAQGRIGNG